MLLLLIFLVLLAIAGKMFLGMALEAIGFVLGLCVIVVILIVKMRRSR